MATRTIIDLTDDLDGTPAEHTVRFSLEDTVYEIDLNSANRDKLTRALAPFAAAARRVRGGIAEADSARTETPVDPRAVREWARARGFDIPAKKRVPSHVIDEFRAAGN
ncbi:histone-like nucleoid-structuring protein Lsr2 [Ruania halotolerans]|uniref:histone-like nucleoid-structuring protein Lsr2 n=1 Tax=Ruania halotolerans TaxID=2897773 RepID=UPI001E382FE4|nr:Lsr2 family protein [Ruania halotolerans]UFU07058.1 Lsr2 family protein [Ruania halotolerans]